MLVLVYGMMIMLSYAIRIRDVLRLRRLERQKQREEELTARRRKQLQRLALRAAVHPTFRAL